MFKYKKKYKDDKVKYAKLGIGVVTTALTSISVKFLYDIRKNSIKKLEKKSMYESQYYVTNTWIKIKNYGLSIEDYLMNNNIESIAIYAAGELGTRLYEELKDSSIKIKYFTDKKIIENDSFMEYDNIPILNIKKYKDKNDVDAIIVTPVYYMESIEVDLRNYGFEKEIISLEKIISDLHNLTIIEK